MTNSTPTEGNSGLVEIHRQRMGLKWVGLEEVSGIVGAV